MKEHILQFFFENVCASCHEEDEFYQLFNRCISKEEKQELSYEIRTYNVFQDADMQAYEKALAENGRSKADTELPVLLIDGKWISGYESIEKELHGVLLGESGSGEENDEQEERQKDEAENEHTTEKTDSVQAILQSDAWEVLSKKDTGILFFDTYSCTDCKEADEYLAGLQDELEFGEIEINVSEGENLALFKELLQMSGRSDEEGKVPAVFAGDQMLLGKEEIQEKLEEVFGSGKATPEELKSSLMKLTGTEEIQTESIPVMFGAGLLAGFNPCSISMLLMLFSILLTGRASVLKNGILYLIGKYATYLGIGILFCVAAAQVDQQLLNKVGSAVGVAVTILFLAAAILNFLDFLNVRKMEYGKVRMQLPAKMRHFNHTLIKKAQNAEGVFLSLLVLGLGIAISIGEFFCTGQIYMASLLYLIKSADAQFVQLIFRLLVYVTAMSIPAVCILLVIYKTKKTQRVSEFMLEHMAAVKLLNAILFACYAVYFVLSALPNVYTHFKL